MFSLFWQVNFRQTTLSELREILIPKLPQKEQNKIIKIVDEIIRIKQQNNLIDTSNLEVIIDRHVYKLYGLTEEEIKIVEESIK